MSIQTEIDDVITSQRPILISRQNTYLGLRNRYFQGKLTHSIIPDGINDVVADRLNVKPTDQNENWTDFGISSFTRKFSIQIDVYNGQHGKGYVITARVRIIVVDWFRSYNIGPSAEDYRNTAWVRL